MKSCAAMWLAGVLLLAPPLASAREQPKETMVQLPAPVASAANSPQLQPVAPPAEVATKGQFEVIVAEVARLSAAVTKLTEKPRETDFWTLGFSLLGSLCVAIATYLGTRAIAKSRETADFQLAMSKAKLDVAKSLVDWKLRQLSELYGPLRTLFAQSNAIYRVMNMVLQTAAPDKFKLLTPDDLKTQQFKSLSPLADEDGHLFVFAPTRGGAWERFRTVMFIDEVYGRDYGVELYFDQIVEISKRLVTVIETKAGLATDGVANRQLLAGQGDGSTALEDSLRHKFGQYLAHAAVLQFVHANRQAVFLQATAGSSPKTQKAPNLATHESAAFPQRIQRLVGAAYDELQRDLAEWARSAH